MWKLFGPRGRLSPGVLALSGTPAFLVNPNSVRWRAAWFQAEGNSVPCRCGCVGKLLRVVTSFVPYRISARETFCENTKRAIWLYFHGACGGSEWHRTDSSVAIVQGLSNRGVTLCKWRFPVIGRTPVDLYNGVIGMLRATVFAKKNPSRHFL